MAVAPARRCPASDHGRPAVRRVVIPEVGLDEPTLPSERYRVLTRQRSGYDGVMFDVQLQVISTGALVWAQSFSDEAQAEEFHTQLERDLEELELDAFRSRYSVPSSS